MKTVFVTVGTTSFDELIETIISSEAVEVGAFVNLKTAELWLNMPNSWVYIIQNTPYKNLIIANLNNRA